MGAPEVGRGGLQGVEQQAGSSGLYLSAEDEAHDLHERDLDGFGVLEHGHIDDGAAAAGAIGVEDDASVAPTLVKVTEMLAPEGGRSALGAVGFDVFATSDVTGIKRHEMVSTPSPLIFWNQSDTGGLRSKFLSLKELQGKSWEQMGCEWGRAF